MLEARATAGASVGDLALVPLADPGLALAIATDEIDEAVATVRMQARAHNYVKRRAEQSGAAALVEWQDTSGRDICEQVVQMLPGLDEGVMLMQGFPGSSSFQWLRLCLPADKLVPKILGMRRTEQVQEVLNEVRGLWMRRHRQLRSGAQTPLVDPPRKNPKQKPACLHAKYCLCGDRGDEIWSINLKVLSALRAAMKILPAKRDLQMGDVVMALTPLKMEHVDAIEGGALDVMSCGEDLLLEYGLAHISLLYEHPLRPTTRCLRVPKLPHCGPCVHIR